MGAYYAARYPQGYAISSVTRRPIRTVHRFDSTAERDAWIAARRSNYCTDAGYREALNERQVSASERDALIWATPSND